MSAGRLAAADTRPAKARRAMGLRFLFDCGVVTDEQAASITLQSTEPSNHAFLAPSERWPGRGRP